MDNFFDTNYQEFTESDFISDPFFQDWVLHPATEKERFWKNFLLAHPQKKEAIENARLLLKNINFKEDVPDEGRVTSLFKAHLETIESLRKAKVVRFNSTVWKRMGRIAAIFGGLVLLAALLFLMNRKPYDSVIATSYGELKEVMLPDSTRVVLNAHSKIRYSKKWTADKPREIWLDGEAFFDVKRLSKNAASIRQNERFVVYGDDVTVEVLGTSFNIRQRRGKTEVVLQSGRIKLQVNKEEIIMQPGDWIAYNGEDKNITRSVTVPENYAAWKEKKLLLNDPTVEQIIQYLEDTYGKKIVLEMPELRTKKIEGPILLNNLDDALFVISTVLNVKVEEKDSLLILHSK